MLRQLKESDAEYMLEWMHNEDNTRYFLRDFSSMTLESCRDYIRNTGDDQENFHYAVTNKQDEYLGTISLKNVDRVNKNAEYAISLSPKAIGKGVATEATDDILRVAFQELGLNRVYLNVLADNLRAKKFYEKYGFIYEGVWKEHYILRGRKRDLLWYRILQSEWTKENGI